MALHIEILPDVLACVLPHGPAKRFIFNQLAKVVLHSDHVSFLHQETGPAMHDGIIDACVPSGDDRKAGSSSLQDRHRSPLGIAVGRRYRMLNEAAGLRKKRQDFCVLHRA